MNIPSSLAGKAKSNLIMWSFLPTYLSIAGCCRLSSVPALFRPSHHRTGPAASYHECVGLYPAFATGYAQAWTS